MPLGCSNLFCCLYTPANISARLYFPLFLAGLRAGCCGLHIGTPGGDDGLSLEVIIGIVVAAVLLIIIVIVIIVVVICVRKRRKNSSSDGEFF